MGRLRMLGKSPTVPVMASAGEGSEDRPSGALDAPGAVQAVPSRAARKRAVELERYRRRLASCVECGTLVMMSRDGLGTHLFDWPLDLERMCLLTELVGLLGVMAQGVGPANGAAHLCPPTRHLVDGIGRVTEGGDS